MGRNTKFWWVILQLDDNFILNIQILVSGKEWYSSYLLFYFVLGGIFLMNLFFSGSGGGGGGDFVLVGGFFHRSRKRARLFPISISRKTSIGLLLFLFVSLYLYRLHHFQFLLNVCNVIYPHNLLIGLAQF